MKQIKHHRFMRDRKFKKRGSSYNAGSLNIPLHKIQSITVPQKGIEGLEIKNPIENISIPNESWIGKILEVIKDSSFMIISGSDAYSLNLFENQRLRVIGVQEGNWLRTILLGVARFVHQPGIQMSEFEEDWARKYGTLGQTSSGSGIIIGVSLNSDKDKFKVIG